MLDSSQRNLSAVQNFLAARGLSAVGLFMHLLGRYVTDAEELQQGTSAAVTGQQEDPSEAAWKKAKLELLSKHGSSQNDPSREIQQHRCLSVSAVDPLKWWRSQTKTYIRLSHLARAVLAIPATSATSERIFSAAGAVLNCKSNSLSPHVVDKVIFVHVNGHLLEDV